MKCKNRVELRGYVGGDPKVTNLPGGGLVAEFSVGTTSKWKNKKTGEWDEATEWSNVKAWGYLAERVERDFKKGSYVDIEGRIQTETWKDKQTNEDRSKKVINASDVDLLERRQKAPEESKTASDQQAPPPAGEADDDLPF